MSNTTQMNIGLAVALMGFFLNVVGLSISIIRRNELLAVGFALGLTIALTALLLKTQ